MIQDPILPPSKLRQIMVLLKGLIVVGPCVTYHAWKAARDARKSGATIWLADVRKEDKT